MVQEELNQKQKTVAILYDNVLHAANRVLHQAKKLFYKRPEA